MRGGARSLRMPLAAAFATITATICLGPVFLDGSWFLPTVGVVLVSAAGCEATRRLTGSRLLVPFGGLVALALYLLLRYARAEALAGVLPWGASVDELSRLATLGRTEINRYAAPIGVSPGIELLTVAGVGVVAVLVDTLAVTWRRAALAGLPLLVLYTVTTAVAPDGVSWVAFALAGIGFLTLLLTESGERISRWGRSMRQVSAGSRFESGSGPLTQVGRRVGATALGLALIVPAVLPDLSGSTFGFGGGGFGNGGGGGREVRVVNPILTLGQNLRQGENTTVIRYRGAPTYLRLVGLDTFTGPQWKPSQLKVSRDDNDVEDGLDRPPGLRGSVPTQKRRYDVEVFDLDQTWLPLPYPTKRVRDIDGTWLYDQSTFNVFGENSSTRQISYGVTALRPAFTPDLLRAAPAPSSSVNRYLKLPAGLSDRIESTARAVVGENTTDYDRALALQAWFRSEAFSYSQTLDSALLDGNGADAIIGFLDTRKGYCVQFSSAMAVMARTLGIPARVAVGFAAGTPDGEGGRVVGVNDAHAWPELYFQGAGWVPFEPTPGGPASTPPSWARGDPAGGASGNEPSASPSPSSSATTGLGGSENRAPNIPEPSGAAPGDSGSGSSPLRLPLLPTLVVLGVLLLVAMPALTRWVVRRLRWRDAESPGERARAAWADLQDTLVDHGYDWDEADSPRRGADRLVTARHLSTGPAAAVLRMAAAVERVRYAAAMTPVGNLRADVDVVRSALAQRATRWGRWRAALLPRSTRSVAATVSDRLADGFDGLDGAVSRVTGRLRPRAPRPGS